MNESQDHQGLYDQAVREIRRPYFLLRTPDNLDDYFGRDAYRLIKSKHEAISRFLPRASKTKEEGIGPRGKPIDVVRYDLEPFIDADCTPLEYLTKSEIEAFAQAARLFYEPEAERITEHERTIRKNFKLPDPDKEPECYWVYGPPEQRSLLILWGCEKRQGNSLPLTPLKGDSENTDTIVGRLEKRLMDWGDQQREMLRIFELNGPEKENPVAPFLAMPEFNASGDVVDYIIDVERIDPSKVGKARRFMPGAVRKFEAGASRFYSQTIEDETVSDYEKELRLAFQLPDPELHPDRWGKFKGRPVCLMDLKTPESECLHLTENRDIPIPPPSEERVRSATISERLRGRLAPIKLYSIAAALVVILLIGCLVALELFADKKPPNLVSPILAENDREKVVVDFDEPVDPKSVSWDEGESPKFRIRATDGVEVPVREARVDPDLPSRVILQTGEMNDGMEYELILSGITDNSRKRNAIAENTRESFEFNDTEPPRLLNISSGVEETQIILVFNEPLYKPSAERLSNYEVNGFRVREAILSEDGYEIMVTAEQRVGEEMAGFKDGGIYDITVVGVADNTVERNEIVDEIKFENWLYSDTLPPTVRDITFGQPQQLELLVQFSEEIDQASAQTPSNYVLTASDPYERAIPDIRRASLRDDNKTISLLLNEPLFNGVDYSLAVSGVSDLVEPKPNTLKEKATLPFFFNGREDKTPPAIKEARVMPDHKEVIITFDEPVKELSLLDFEDWSIEGNTTARVYDVGALGTDGMRARIALTEQIPKARPIRLNAVGLTDLCGNTSTNAEVAFQASGSAEYGETLKVRDYKILSSRQMRVSFNGKLRIREAEALENYRLKPDVRIASAQLVDEQTQDVVITFASSLEEGSYRFEARNLVLEQLSWNTQRPVGFDFSVTYNKN